MYHTCGRWFALVGFLLAGLLGRPAFADDPADNMKALAKVILQTFPYQMPSGETAKGGNDWCHVKTDPSENWWGFASAQAPGQIEFIPTRNAVRITLIFKSAQGWYEFASLFLALDTPQGKPYSAGASPPSQIAAFVTLQDKITLPSADPSTCMDLAHFLDAWLWGLLSVHVTTHGDPSCDTTTTGSCGKVAPALPDRQDGTASSDHPFHWNFNGRDHNIAQAFRILLQIPVSGTTATYTYLYLTIGYGGNSGAG